MNVSCPNCHALHFQSEKLVNSSNIHPKFRICCLQGQIQLPSISHSPPLLHQLLNSSTPHAQKFRDSIRQYNSAFTFTSVTMEVDNAVLNGCVPYSFRLHGAMYHKMASSQYMHSYTFMMTRLPLLHVTLGIQTLILSL